MSRAGNALLRGVAPEAVVADLDRLRAAHVVAEQWLLAVENRLAGPALYLLDDELPELTEINRQAAAALAGRVAELDGAITGDPSLLIEVSGLSAFELPADPSDPAAITDYALERVRGLIGAYGEALERTLDADELTHRLLLKLVRQQVQMEADLEGVGLATRHAVIR
jgi:ferritin-like protein